MQQKHNKALRMLMPIKSLWHSDWMKFEMADIPSRPALISVLSGVQRCIFQWEMNNDAVELLFSTFFPSTGWNSTCCVLEKIRPVQTVETWCNATDCEPFPSSVVLHSIKRRLHQRKCQWKKIIRAKMAVVFQRKFTQRHLVDCNVSDQVANTMCQRALTSFVTNR